MCEWGKHGFRSLCSVVKLEIRAQVPTQRLESSALFRSDVLLSKLRDIYAALLSAMLR